MMILHAPHSKILKISNTHVPNLTTDLQSDKNKGKKRPDVRWRHQSFLFKLETIQKQTKKRLHLPWVSIRWGMKWLNRFRFHFPPERRFTAIPVWQYLKLNTYMQESQQNPLSPSSFHLDCHMIWSTECLHDVSPSGSLLSIFSFKTSAPSSGRNRVLNVGWQKADEGRVSGFCFVLNVHDALCVTCIANFHRWMFISMFFFLFSFVF